jgi:ubiquitin C-terminal hydrolase
MLTKNCILNKQENQHENKLKYFSDKNYARVGLNNIGNNCYINSVIQVLKNIPKFTYNFTIFNNNSEKFLTSLKYLLINMCNQNISSVSPLEFKTNLGIENKRFSGNDQYDSTIFYVSLLNIINKKLNELISKK